MLHLTRCFLLLAASALTAFAVPGVGHVSGVPGTSTGVSGRPLASALNPYAYQVVQNSNDGLEAGLSTFGLADADLFDQIVQEGGGEPTFTTSPSCIPDIPTIDDSCTDGWICGWLTYRPAAGCIETAFSGCTTGTCTNTNCTTSNTCTKATQCTNVPGHTDKGVCTQQNNCTGGPVCTESAGCTQGNSCTSGAHCTDDQGVCTGGATCTQGTGCTNGAGCTSGAGCTNDAQCTGGTSCTEGAGCTNGGSCTDGTACTASSLCTQGTSCTSGPQCTQGSTCTAGPQCPASAAAKTGPISNALLAHLERPGYCAPVEDPHGAAPTSLASMTWLLLLLVPAVARRRNGT